MKERFKTGAVRDQQKGKPRFDLISPFAELALAQVSEEGAKRYADRNWERGIPLMRICASLRRHLNSWQLSKTNENHLEKLLWNAHALVHLSKMIELGLLPKELDDRPRYGKKGKKQLSRNT